VSTIYGAIHQQSGSNTKSTSHNTTGTRLRA